MWKKLLLAWLLVFITISILDYILHSLILMSIYEETKELWRPEGEMKIGVMYLVTIISTFCFVYIYSKFVSPKSTKNAVMYGLFWGLSAGISMGYGMYSVMDIPYSLALGWFLGTTFEVTAAGFVLGMVIKE